ncbi:MAG: hypothetical protein NUK65_06610 [Firmicutes bacterium]|nr:hypothetical protein [Bacillota bacterium]
MENTANLIANINNNDRRFVTKVSKTKTPSTETLEGELRRQMKVLDSVTLAASFWIPRF